MERMDDNGHGTASTYPVERQSPMVNSWWPPQEKGEPYMAYLDRVAKRFRMLDENGRRP